MSKQKVLVELFFDVISPYSWIGFEALCRYRSVWNINLKLRPFFLGGVMQATGNRPPGVVPAKMQYMAQDLQHLREYWHLPINGLSDPAGALFDKGSLSASRYLVSLARVDEGRVEAAARELWMRRWSRDEDIHLPDHLMQVSKAIGLADATAHEVVAKLAQQDVKDQLKANTTEAVDSGAFGAPWIVVHWQGERHVFFGADRFPIIARLLNEEYPGPLTNRAKL